MKRRRKWNIGKGRKSCVVEKRGVYIVVRGYIEVGVVYAGKVTCPHI